MTSISTPKESKVEYIKSFQIDPAWEDFGKVSEIDPAWEDFGKVSEEPESFAINPAWEDFGKYEEPERFAIDPSWEDFGKLDSKKFKVDDDEFELMRDRPYYIYSSEMSSVVKKENPDMSIRQIISHIGEKWRKEEDEKLPNRGLFDLKLNVIIKSLLNYTHYGFNFKIEFNKKLYLI